MKLFQHPLDLAVFHIELVQKDITKHTGPTLSLISSPPKEKKIVEYK